MKDEGQVKTHGLLLLILGSLWLIFVIGLALRHHEQSVAQEQQRDHAFAQMQSELSEAHIHAQHLEQQLHEVLSHQQRFEMIEVPPPQQVPTPEHHKSWLEGAFRNRPENRT
jgi:hypothetical protein